MTKILLDGLADPPDGSRSFHTGKGETMELPHTITLIRHTKSGINTKLASTVEGALKFPMDLNIRLVPKGIEDADRLGAILREHHGDELKRIDDYRVSPLKRPIETAGHLKLPNAHWTVENRLRERDYGECYGWDHDLVRERTPYFHQWRQADPLNARPPMGESISDMAEGRVRYLIEDLARNGSKHCFLVAHGDVMYAFLAYIKKLDPRAFARIYQPPYFGFGDMLTFSRIRSNTPNIEIRDWYDFVRCLRPLSEEHPANLRKVPFEEHRRQKYSNDDLLRIAEADLEPCLPWVATHGHTG